MKKTTSFLFALCLSLAAGAAGGQTAGNPVLRIATSIGNIDVQLYPSVTPQTDANFLNYANNGLYNNTIIQRAIADFIVQGGGYTDQTGTITTVPANAPVQNEAYLPNRRGTLAMSLSGGNVNGATNQWFFNLADNSGTLDAQKYTVFASVANKDSLVVLDAITALHTINVGPGLTDLPVVNYTNGSLLTPADLVVVQSVTALPSHAAFFQRELPVGEAVNYMQFSNGNLFGYFTYLSDARYFYHYDMGWEYIFDANDGNGGVYLYDFASNTFFYTSPKFPFPYLYDFSLKSVVYYCPDQTHSGHYTSNPRYFANMTTGKIITK